MSTQVKLSDTAVQDPWLLRHARARHKVHFPAFARKFMVGGGIGEAFAMAVVTPTYTRINDNAGVIAKGKEEVAIRFAGYDRARREFNGAFGQQATRLLPLYVIGSLLFAIADVGLAWGNLHAIEQFYVHQVVGVPDSSVAGAAPEGRVDKLIDKVEGQNIGRAAVIKEETKNAEGKVAKVWHLFHKPKDTNTEPAPVTQQPAN